MHFFRSQYKMLRLGIEKRWMLLFCVVIEKQAERMLTHMCTIVRYITNLWHRTVIIRARHDIVLFWWNENGTLCWSWIIFAYTIPVAIHIIFFLLLIEKNFNIFFRFKAMHTPENIYKTENVEGDNRKNTNQSEVNLKHRKQ